MAWIEIRGKQPRAYSRTPTGRTYEPFTTVDDAEKFLALGAVLDGDFEKARALVRGAELAGLRLPTSDAAHGPAAMVAAPGDGDYPPETNTLAYVFEAYVTSCKARPRGKDDYRRDFRLHIAPYFGEGTDVRRLTGRFYLPGQKPDPAGAATGTNVAAWLEWLEQRPAFDRWGKPTDRALSPKTIRSLHGLLSAALEYACRVEPTPLLLRNPCAGSNLPEAIPMPMHFLTRTGAQALLRHLDGMAYVVVLFALYTGLRFGEIAGLDIRDLDLDAEIPTVQVRQAWSRVTVAGPKGTRRSTRMLALPKTVESHRKIGFPRFLAATSAARSRRAGVKGACTAGPPPVDGAGVERCDGAPVACAWEDADRLSCEPTGRCGRYTTRGSNVSSSHSSRAADSSVDRTSIPPDSHRICTRTPSGLRCMAMPVKRRQLPSLATLGVGGRPS